MERIQTPDTRKGFQFVGHFEHGGVQVEPRFISPYDGVIHHGRALEFLEEERSRIFADHGVSMEQVAEKMGLVGQTVQVGIEFRGRVSAGDPVRVETEVYDFNDLRFNLAFHHKVFRNDSDSPAIEAVVYVWIFDKGSLENLKYGEVPVPARLPKELLDRFRAEK